MSLDAGSARHAGRAPERCMRSAVCRDPGQGCIGEVPETTNAPVVVTGALRGGALAVGQAGALPPFS